MKKSIVCFGETLWDMLPTGAVPGGAPLNVAVRAQSLGNQASIISRIGNDELGELLFNWINEQHVDTSLLQVDHSLPTGNVEVTLDSNGVASYSIKQPVAWDNIQFEGIEKMKEADAFVFGSLACRNETSRKTLLNLLNLAKFKVFDVNLRAGFFDLNQVISMIKSVDLLKLNEEELEIISNYLGLDSTSAEERIKHIHETFHVPKICITRGENGAILSNQNGYLYNAGLSVKVADTVGAGDSFLAALLHQILHEKPAQFALDYACAVGTVVATKQGANAGVSIEEIEFILERFQS